MLSPFKNDIYSAVYIYMSALYATVAFPLALVVYIFFPFGHSRKIYTEFGLVKYSNRILSIHTIESYFMLTKTEKSAHIHTHVDCEIICMNFGFWHNHMVGQI